MTTEDELPVSVSVSIIAYNEEAIISDTIRHILPYEYVKEVVICDTGSTDRTREQAAQAGARVVNIGWYQDFAYARNHALMAARTEWVITTDCDERMSDELICLVPSMINYGNHQNVGAFYFWRVSVFDGQNVGEEYQPRLLHRQRAKWVNKIHEGISLGNGYKAKKIPRDFILRHEHTMKKQLWANKLYYNINNGIDRRPGRDEGCQYNDTKKEWEDVKL